MSRHQDIRNLDYHDELDDYDGYSEEDNELSPEDQVLMKQGTVEVRAALGIESSKITTAQIEEALWHYYYDIDKSVAYLISKFVDPPKKTPKSSQMSGGKSNHFTLSLAPSGKRPSVMADGHSSKLVLPSKYYPRASLTLCQGVEYSFGESRAVSLDSQAISGKPSHLFRATQFATHGSSQSKSLSHFFRDMPWGNIPQSRVAVFIPPPRPQGGLLGGSGAAPKMSKLQQLAAARKKKAEEKIEQAQTKMAELSVDNAPKAKENIPPPGPFGKRQKTSNSTAEGRNPLTLVEPARPESAQQTPVEPTASQGQKPDMQIEAPLTKARPSAFAQIITSGQDSSLQRRKAMEEFTLPYLEIAPSAIDVFSKPSPDDVVLTAQAKGSIVGKAKR